MQSQMKLGELEVKHTFIARKLELDSNKFRGALRKVTVGSVSLIRFFLVNGVDRGQANAQLELLIKENEKLRGVKKCSISNIIAPILNFRCIR
jgi:hypothetical protein